MEIGIIWHEFGGGLVERLTRREFLKLVGAGTAWVMLGGCVQPPSVTPSPTTPQPQVTKELKIGVISYRTGPLAMFGEPFHHASDYIADSLNAADGVGGFKIKILHEDQGSTASETVEKAKKLILEDKVDVITGIPATGHSLGVAPVCDSNNVLYLQVQARPEYGTWRDIDNPSKGIFDWVFQLGNSTTSHALQYVYIVKDLYPEVKTIAQIHPDYAYGYDIYNIFTSALKKLKPGLEFFDPLYPKLFTPDYTPYINELVKMKPDLIYVGLWGTDFTRFVDQLLPYGLLKGAGGKTILAGFWDYYPSIGREIPVYGHPQASNQGLFDYPGYKEVIKTIVWHYKTYGWFQTGGTGDAFAALYILKAAIEKAYKEKGRTPTRDEIRDALENVGKVVTPLGEAVMRKEDHRTLWSVECGNVIKDTYGYFEGVGTAWIYDPKNKIILPPEKHEPPAFKKGPEWIKTW